MFLKTAIYISLFSFILYSMDGTDSSKVTSFRTLENKAFKEGEKLTYNIDYGFVTAGIAVMQIPKIKRISGRDAYHITFEVNTVPSFDMFFKVRDRYETYMDTEGLFPWRFEQHIREGSFSRDFSAFFDQRKNIAKTGKGQYDVPPYVHDIVSAFYYARTLDYSNLKVNDKFHLQNFYKDKVHDLDVVYHGKETVEVPAGKFDCIVVEPLVKEGGLFKHEGNIIVWLTDDDLRVPVKVKTKIVVGYIDANLTDYEGLAGKFTAKR